MNARARVLAALNHQEPDRPPRDLGSTTAAGIHPAAYQALKAHLWGGVDTQAVLPSCSAQDVCRKVQRLLDDLAPGGYVLAAVHDVQPEVPPANLCAMFEPADRWESHV